MKGERQASILFISILILTVMGVLGATILFLAEKELEVPTEQLNVRDDDQFVEPFTSMNPFHCVPFLELDTIYGELDFEMAGTNNGFWFQSSNFLYGKAKLHWLCVWQIYMPTISRFPVFD